MQFLDAVPRLVSKNILGPTQTKFAGPFHNKICFSFFETFCLRVFLKFGMYLNKYPCCGKKYGIQIHK